MKNPRHRYLLYATLLMFIGGFLGCTDVTDGSSDPEKKDVDTPPSAVIVNPTGKDSTTTNESSITIKGYAFDDKEVKEMTLQKNGVSEKVRSYSKNNTRRTNAEFQFENITLQVGDNIFKVTATDEKNQIGNDTITITYNPYLNFASNAECTPNVVFINEPTYVTVTVPIANNPNLIQNSVQLLRETGIVEREYQSLKDLQDNGDLSNYGDKVAGDGIFSTKYNFSESVIQNINFRISAQTLNDGKVNTAYTEIFQIKIRKRMTEEEYNKHIEYNQLAQSLSNEGKSLEEIAQEISKKPEVEKVDLLPYDVGILTKYKDGLENCWYKKIDPQVISQAPNINFYDDKNFQSTLKKIILKPKYQKAVIWSSIHSDPDTGQAKWETELESYLRNQGVTVDTYYDTNATIDVVVNELKKYGLVFMGGHGRFLGENNKYSFGIQTGEEDTWLNNHPIYFYNDLTFSNGAGQFAGKQMYYITPQFIQNYSAIQPESIVFFIACNSSRYPRKIIQSLLALGADTVYGFHMPVNFSFAQKSYHTIYTNLFNGIDTFSAYDLVSPKNDPDWKDTLPGAGPEAARVECFGKGVTLEDVHTVTGKTRYSTTPFPGIRVELIIGDVLNPPAYSCTSNGNGEFIFTGVKSGEYWIKTYGPTSDYIEWKASNINVYSDVNRNTEVIKKITLISPEDSSQVANLSPKFTWASLPEATRYQFQLNESITWNLVDLQSVYSDSYQTLQILTEGIAYAWQIDAYDQFDNSIGSTDYAFQFTPYLSTKSFEKKMIRCPK